MSSRALRKLQREQEHKAQQSIEREEDEHDDSGDEVDSSINVKNTRTKKFNAFDILNEAEEEESDAQDTERVPSSPISSNLKDATPSCGATQEESSLSHTGKAKGHQKRKKQKKKKQVEEIEGQSHRKDADLDEIDIAISALGMKAGDGEIKTQQTAELSSDLVHLYQLLATDTKNLNALNEMKRLFGNAVLEGENDHTGAPGPGRRRGRAQQQLDLGGALMGRNSPVSRGKGLAGLALRRNVFMLGKEEWSKATSGGLGMDIVEKASDLTTEYRFVHNSTYQDVQRQFESCAESLDPQRMIQLLQFNPYHISTLLQVSEIAKQQGDHSVSGDLLERALFSFGRSVHSSFHTSLAKGEARLDFRRPENREFWLASWRYISNLGQRGTWRTAYEWARLILGLDPEGDPYCIGLILDQLALRGGQFEQFVDLANAKDSCFGDWGHFPNIKISKALAEYRLKRPTECRASLAQAIMDYPWLFARLFQELNLDHIPKSIWGKEARSEREKLESETYISRARDLWNTPETISLLVEVAQSVAVAPGGKINNEPITLNEARHLLLSDIPALISLLPRSLTSMQTSASDPLPPPDNISPYDFIEPSGSYQSHLHSTSLEHTDADALPAEAADEAREFRGLQAFFSRFIPWLGVRESTASGDDTSTQSEEHSVAELAQAVSDSGIAAEVIEERGVRMMELQRRMIDLQRHQLEATEQQFLGHAEVSQDQDGSESRAMADFPSSLDEGTSFRAAPGHTAQPLESTGNAGQNHSTTASEPYNDERNQRWLAGQGLLRLRDFISEHGTDEGKWRDRIVDISPVNEYVQRVDLLEKVAIRNFILDYVLQQGTSGEVRDLIRSKIKT